MAELEVPSKDMRYRLRSTVASAERARLPVLRFFGNDSGGTSLPRPRSPSPVLSSVPIIESTGTVSKAVVGHGSKCWWVAHTLFLLPAMHLQHPRRRDNRAEKTLSEEFAGGNEIKASGLVEVHDVAR